MIVSIYLIYCIAFTPMPYTALWALILTLLTEGIITVELINKIQ